MSMFRFPTRFLIVVELGLALLAAAGLTRLREDLQRGLKLPARAAIGLSMALCAVTALDLFVHQPRQNPLVPAREWLAPSETAKLVAAGTEDPRTFTPRHRDLHRSAFQAAHGWADVTPYFAMRDLLEPNLGGGVWNVPSGDCYAGVSARWYVDVWGDHNRELSLLTLLSAYDARTGVLRMQPHAVDLLRGYGVTDLISPAPLQDVGLTRTARTPNAYLYRITGSSRAWFVPSARAMNDADAAKRLLEPSFDPSREVLLQDVDDPAALPPAGNAGGSSSAVPARLAPGAGPDEVTIDADAPQSGYVVFADTFYPGWSADVDGHPAAMYRANLSIRAIPVGAGRHRIRLRYQAPGWRAGVTVTLGSIALLLLWLAFGDRRRIPTSPTPR